MATYTLQFSCHGIARDVNDNPVGDFTLPKGTTVHYFVREGELLDYDVSIDIYNELLNNDLQKVNNRIVETKGGDNPVKNYSLWDLQDQRFVSGSLRVGEKEALINIDGTTYDNPTNFRDLYNESIAKLGALPEDSVIIYFNACREK